MRLVEFLMNEDVHLNHLKNKLAKLEQDKKEMGGCRSENGMKALDDITDKILAVKRQIEKLS